MAAQYVNQSDWQCNKSFLECSKHMFENNVASDVTFLVGASEEVVQAHKFVLVARSPVFETMLCGSMQENPIKILDAEIVIFRAFLWSLYTDENKIETSNAFGLHYLATKYTVPWLQKAASDFMQTNMCTAPDLLYPTYNFSISTGDTALQESCIQGFVMQKEGVVMSDHFLELSKNAVAKLVENDYLPVPEVVLFNGCNRWAENQCRKKGIPADGPNRRAELEDAILPHIRFPQMSLTEFTDHVSRDGILSENECFAMFQYYGSKEKPPVPYRTEPRDVFVKVQFQWQQPSIQHQPGPLLTPSRLSGSTRSTVSLNCRPRQSGAELRALFDTKCHSMIPGCIVYNDRVVSDTDVVDLSEGARVIYR